MLSIWIDAELRLRAVLGSDSEASFPKTKLAIKEEKICGKLMQ